MANQKHIHVYLDWLELSGIQKLGVLQAEQLRGKEVFSFSYNKEWLESGLAMLLDPELGLYGGAQYLRDNKPNFGLFTDSSPDRWGRVLMQRREALTARNENRKARPLFESDFLLGVYDHYRMGALRFRLTEDGPFLHDEKEMTVPPFTSIRTLEEASLRLEEHDNLDDPAFTHWLNLLISPGSSLGGARPKASVKDTDGNLWIAKFPSRNDERDIGAWEAVVHELALKAGLSAGEGIAKRFSQANHTFLTKRFDRMRDKRIHFASAMTLLGYSDGMDAGSGISYLHLAEFIMRQGAAPDRDLEELWRRIIFYILVSNSDDHLRNHGFLLTTKGWRLSPAFDINPTPGSTGLTLNITEHSNILDIDLARAVAEQFRIGPARREEIIATVTTSVNKWRIVAQRAGVSRREIEEMRDSFKVL